MAPPASQPQRVLSKQSGGTSEELPVSADAVPCVLLTLSALIPSSARVTVLGATCKDTSSFSHRCTDGCAFPAWSAGPGTWLPRWPALARVRTAPHLGHASLLRSSGAWTQLGSAHRCNDVPSPCTWCCVTSVPT